ncbi:hypothetical protein GCM10027155_18140 [Acinetobacter apis]|uniref:Lipoprotein n=1 Tax=Acinetobacter apis TaxID=1229165 RepID=A0A217EGH5_9GAMM|nr:hypothetical protein [Acinetobacter apis]SNQ29447.1 hypothetical protein SAMN05444584_1401 [Acinetobacter apis]
MHQFRLYRSQYVLHVLLLSTVGLIGCSNSNEQLKNHEIKPVNQSDLPAPVPSEHSGNLLSIAGKATAPKVLDEKPIGRILNQEEKTLVGRYKVTISCKDPIARCTENEKGSVDFILNLLPNGTVYRFIKGLGAIKLDSRNSPHYFRDHWGITQINQSKYVVISYSTGMRVFYRVEPNHSLLMDTSRNKLVNLKAYRAGYPFASQNYYLKRVPE